jgi:hypothetical protein
MCHDLGSVFCRNSNCFVGVLVNFLGTQFMLVSICCQAKVFMSSSRCGYQYFRCKKCDRECDVINKINTDDYKNAEI